MPRSDPLIGLQLANYRIERLLGRGGMASVYYGVDLHLNRPAAIKVIDDRYRDNSAYAERFVREARAMASWRHPNIPQIYQAGVEGGYYFYAMEYVEGLDLGQLIHLYTQRGELLPYEDVIRIGRAVSEALDYAHGRGAVHRDVKPSNVLVAQDGRILLTDFGLVMHVDKETRGEVFGSPHYIAPEQARSSAGAVPQSDLYSLGVVLYELLVGRLPFDDPSPASLVLKHIGELPPPPRQFNPNLSPAVEAILVKALRKDPRERFQTGSELMYALGLAIKGQTASGTAPDSETIPPVTIPVLPEDTADLPRMTVSNLRVAELVASDLSTQPPTQAVLDSETRNVPKSPERRISPLPGRWAGCAAIFALGLLALVCTGTLASRWLSLNQGQSPPASTSAASSRPAISQTETTPTASVPPTNPEARTTATPPATQTPPAPTTTPEQVSVDGREFHLLLASEKDDSLFVINQSRADLPLALLQLGSGEGQIVGDEWGIDLLRPGQCVTVWKKEGKPKSPKGVDCDVVGGRLERSGSEKFWDSDFEIYFNDISLGVCQKRSQTCELRFTVFP